MYAALLAYMVMMEQHGLLQKVSNLQIITSINHKKMDQQRPSLAMNILLVWKLQMGTEKEAKHAV